MANASRLVAGLAGLTLLAGCNGSTGGVPAAASGTSGLPARPQQLRLAGVDPCGLLTTDQRSQLGLNDASPPIDPTPDRRSCQFLHFPGPLGERYDMRLELTVGVGLALAAASARVVSVAGFGGVETRTNFGDQERTCAVFVDVADNQDVAVFYSADSDVPMTRAVACEKARSVAELVVRNLIAQQR